MNLVTIREHNGIRIYGYSHGTEVVYWSMHFYEETWHFPMIVMA